MLQGGKFVDDSSSSSSSDDDSDQVGKIVQMSDEALFAACGGMTGHKGARHGINMTAKLNRIKQQELIGMRKLKNLKANGSSDCIPKPGNVILNFWARARSNISFLLRI